MKLIIEIDMRSFGTSNGARNKEIQRMLIFYTTQLTQGNGLKQSLAAPDGAIVGHAHVEYQDNQTSLF